MAALLGQVGLPSCHIRLPGARPKSKPLEKIAGVEKRPRQGSFTPLAGPGRPGFSAKNSGQASVRPLPGKGCEEGYRFAAAEALVGVGPDAKAVVPDLIEALKDRNRSVRFYAACALAQIDPENKAAAAVLVGELPALIALLKDFDGRRVAFAADVLGCLGSKAEPAVPALREAVAHPRQWAVPGGAAMRALRKIRPAARAEEEAPP
jgi:hypothetical protein